LLGPASSCSGSLDLFFELGAGDGVEIEEVSNEKVPKGKATSASLGFDANFAASA